MPRGRPRKAKPEPIIEKTPLEQRRPEELDEFIHEANEVKQLTSMYGWQVLKRDIQMFQQSIVSKLAYAHPKRPEYYEAKLLYIACDKLLSLVDDYEVNKAKAVELLQKLQNPDVAISMDVDNE